MLRRDRRRLDIAGNSQLSRIKTEQAILNFFDWDQLGNRLSVFRDNEFCLPCLHFIHNCQALSFECSRRDRFQEHLTMVIIPWSHSPVCGNQGSDTNALNVRSALQGSLHTLCSLIDEPEKGLVRLLGVLVLFISAMRFGDGYSPGCE